MSNKSKKDQIETSKLSSTVLDYYYKFGQNRDLEKYLRVKRRSPSKSSSDSSLKNYASADSSTLDCKRITKSMEKLNSSDPKIRFADQDEKNTSGSRRTGKSNAELTENELKSKQKSNEPQPIKIEKKTQQQWKGKSKSKSYNFNMESSIEINLPSTSSMPALPVSTQTIDSSQKSYQIAVPQLETIETQTDSVLIDTETSKEVQIDRNERITSSNVNAPISERQSDRFKSTAEAPATEGLQETSPASSVASAAKVRLEWDSMADIGYNRFIDFKSQSNSNLTTFERSALTKFFARRGLNFDDNLVILAPPASSTTMIDNKSPLQKRKFTQSAIEMRETQKIRADLTPSTKKLSPATDKQLWERALMKYREKYGNISSKVTNESGEDRSNASHFTAPPHHSTPLPSDMSKINLCNTGDDGDKSKYKTIEIDTQKVQQPVSPPPPPVSPPQYNEKWCQTSLIDVKAIGIQAESRQPQIQHASKTVQSEIGK